MTEQQIEPLELNSIERELYERIQLQCDDAITMTKRYNPPGTLFVVRAVNTRAEFCIGQGTTLSTALAKFLKATTNSLA